MDKKKIIAFGILILILLILVVVYFISKKVKHNVIVEEPLQMETDFVKIISPEKFPDSDSGIKFTYSMWLYINNVPENAHWINRYKSKRFIVYRYGSPNVIYYPENHILAVGMTYKNNLDIYTRYYHDIPNLPVQSWNHISFTVDNRYFNVYLNGELVGSKILDSVPFVFERFLYLGQKNNNFNGYISHFEYYNDVLNSKSIKNIYLSQKDKMDPKVESYSRLFYKKRLQELEKEQKLKELNQQINYSF